MTAPRLLLTLLLTSLSLSRCCAHGLGDLRCSAPPRRSGRPGSNGALTRGGGGARVRWGRALHARGGGGGRGTLADAPHLQPPRPAAKSALNLASASAFSVLAGSFYLWSMLLPALQADIDGCSRATLSAVFSVSTVCFTAGTSLGPMLFGTILPVSGVVLLTGVASALGLLLAAEGGAAGGSLTALAAGYAGVFGTSTGVSYALNMKVSNAPGLFDGWQGVATGIIVSFRALGAPMLAPFVRRALSGGGGAREALRTMAGAVAVLSLPIAALMSRTSWEDLGAKVAVVSSPDNLNMESDAPPPLSEHRASLTLLWVCLLCGSFPGLLAHGHAGAMAASRGGAAAAGVSAMATGSLWGRLGAGVVVDILSPKVCLVATPILAAAAIGCGAALPGTVPLNVALCGMGLCYGMNAVVISVMTARIVGPDAFSRAYGLVFTSWGTAGIVAPILAGLLYDATGGYTAAILVAAVSTLLAAVAAAFLPNPE